MAITDSLARLAGTLLATLHTRLELISVEIEEELACFSSYLLWSIVALGCAAIAVLLSILLIVALFWDSHRFLVLASLIVIFAGSALGLALWLHAAIRAKPRFLASSLDELQRDSAALYGKTETKADADMPQQPDNLSQ
jgi:uncharacterized membrane protein YqjE